MLRTLFLTVDYPPDLGGMARMYGELCARFPPGSVEVCTIAESGPSGSVSAQLEPHRMPFSRRQARTLTTVIRWTRWTQRHLRERAFSLIQVGNIRPCGYIAAWLQARHCIPFVLYVHGKDVRKERIRSAHSARARWTSRSILGRASAIIANSTATARDTRAHLRAIGAAHAAERVVVVNPGTDPERFRPDAPGAFEWRKRLTGDGERIVLSVARLMPRKGIDTAIDALPALLAAGHRLVYAVAGTGPDLPRLRARAAERGVAHCVNFLGTVADHDLAGLYAASDLFVLPVREEPGDEVEGFGIVYLEAAASGLPVVAGASGGVADAVQNGETGILVRPEDPNAARVAISRLLDDDALHRRLATAGRSAVEQYFNWDRAASEVFAILNRVADGSSRPPDPRLSGTESAVLQHHASQ